MKRMNGEDVFGSRIQTSIEPLTPYDAKIQQMANLSGSDFSKSFPPEIPPPTAPPMNTPRFHSPHMPTRHVGVRTFGPRMGPSINRPPPPQRPPPSYPSKMQPPYSQQIPFSPTSPDQPRPFLVRASPPQHTRIPAAPIRGKILVFRIPPVPETHLDQLNGHMVSVRLEAFVKVSVFLLKLIFFLSLPSLCPSPFSLFAPPISSIYPSRFLYLPLPFCLSAPPVSFICPSHFLSLPLQFVYLPVSFPCPPVIGKASHTMAQLLGASDSAGCGLHPDSTGKARGAHLHTTRDGKAKTGGV